MGQHRSNPFARQSRATVASLPTQVRDSYLRPLTEGDEVICPGVKLEAPRFVVSAIRPDLRPQAQPNTVLVQLTCSVTLVAPATAPMNNVFLLRTVEEIAEAMGQTRPTAPPEGEDTLPAQGAPPAGGPIVVTDPE